MLPRPSISIHALLAESDDAMPLTTSPLPKFLSTLSLRRATLWSAKTGRHFRYFYPRSPCGERQHRHRHYHRRPKFLSTLSLRRATGRCPHSPLIWQISIHALLAESDQPATRPAQKLSNFYPRSPCGERPRGSAVLWVPSPFLSTLSLRRATSYAEFMTWGAKFLSTLSLRRATETLAGYRQ